MKLSFTQVRDAALTMRKRDRAKLFELLEETLDPPHKDVDDMDDAELEAELNRRYEESVRDPSVMIPGDVVMERIRKKYLC